MARWDEFFMLMICLFSLYSWGYVCDDGGNLNQLGQVVCRNLGRDFVSAQSGVKLSGQGEIILFL